MNEGKREGYRALQNVMTEKWIWCQRCSRCYLDGEFRLSKGIKLCPYADCIGLIEIDGWPWLRILKEYPKEYPPIPERGVVYTKILE